MVANLLAYQCPCDTHAPQGYFGERERREEAWHLSPEGIEVGSSAYRVTDLRG